jgi:hypothetical protein
LTILLDPSRDGCTIWFLESASVKHIYDRTANICRRIFNFCTYEADNNKIIQCVDIMLDANGIGQAYADVFEKEYHLKFTEVKLERDLLI